MTTPTRPVVSLDPADHRSGPLPLFLVPPSNDKGQHVVISFRTDPHTKRTVDVILYEGIAKGTHSWKTPSDVYRWLFLAGLQAFSQIADQEGQGLHLAFHEAINHVDQAKAQVTQARALLHGIRDHLGELISMEKMQDAKVFLQVEVEKILEMPATGPREWLLETLKTEYEDFLTAARPSASLGPLTMTEMTTPTAKPRRVKQ